MRERRRRVLVAEDSAELRDSIAAVLRSVGFDVAIACDGQELLEAFDGGRMQPDVVLADVQLPPVDGVEAMRRLRTAGVETPFVFMTGLVGAALASLKRNLGSEDELVLKPFYISEVLAAVGRATNSSASRTSAREAVESLRAHDDADAGDRSCEEE